MFDGVFRHITYVRHDSNLRRSSMYIGALSIE